MLKVSSVLLLRGLIIHLHRSLMFRSQLNDVDFGHYLLDFVHALNAAPVDDVVQFPSQLL